MDFIFKVDPIRRSIKVPDAFTVLTMDHNIHKLVFICPYYEDFAFDSASIVFMVDAPDGKQYSIPAEEYESFPNSPSPYVKFTLTLKSYITSVVGYMSFCITADIISSGNVIEKSWHSKNITISIGGHINNDDSEDIPEEDVPTINQRLNNLDSKVGRLQTAVNGMSGGVPPTASSTSGMNPEVSPIYVNITDGNWYYYNGSAWQIGGTYGGAVTSTTFNQHGVPADDFAVGEALAEKADSTDVTALDTRVTALEEGGSGSGITAAVKNALLALFRNVAYIGTDGQDLYDDLYDAFYAVTAIRLDNYSLAFTTAGDTAQITATTVPAGGTVTWESSDTSVATVDQTGLVTSVGYGSAVITATSGSASASCSITVSQATLSGISAVYTQSGTVYPTTALDTLKPDIVVTASWSDGTTSTVSSSMYVLSGTLSVGSSTVTVSYGGKTTTFSVLVSEEQAVLQSITAVFNQGSAVIYTDSSLDDLKPYLTVTARYSDSTTQTITNYALSGTLTAGTSIITASYGGMTATFNVTVSERSATLQSISATFTQGSAVIYTDSSLNDLKPYLVVTARYSDNTTQTVTGYTLSGTLTAGTSTITASYGGMTDTFSVTVTDSSTPIPSGYTLKSYVQSNGDAYIDTGYRLIAGTASVPIIKSFEGKFAVSAVSENKNLFGYQGTPSGDVSIYRFMPFIKVSENNLYYYGRGSGVSSAVQGWEPSGINEISVYFYGYSVDYPVFIVNGVQTTGDKQRPLNYSSEQGTVYLCSQNYKASGPTASDTTVDGGYIRCYGFKIQEHDIHTGDDTVVMDFRPCVRNSDGVAGFYETVNGMFYPSIGGNAFVAGD